MKLKDFDFRVWNEKENEFVNIDCSISFKFGEKYERQDYVHFTSYIYEGGIRDKEHTWIAPLCYENDDLELELFTGLYDKNGKKIYEGDILYSFEDCPEDENFMYVVKFKNGAFYLVEPEDMDSVGEQGDVIYCPEEFEVVGNIHENSELLKSKDSK